MKIESPYYDIIDYFQDYEDDKVFLRKESAIFCDLMGWREKVAQYRFKKSYEHQPNIEHINLEYDMPLGIYLDSKQRLEWQKYMESTPIKASFHFLPNPEICIPLDLYLKKVNNSTGNIILKERDSSEVVTSDPIFIGRRVDHDAALMEFFKTEYKSNNWKYSLKPCWYIVIRGVYRANYRKKELSFSLSNETIWVNPPLSKIPNLMQYFNGYTDLYQQIETYLWSDVELEDPMKDIRNDDRIIGHGYDLKTSFRREKEK
jgi:hypothetical protein